MQLALAQRKLQLDHTYQKRTFSFKSYKKLVTPPEGISLSNSHQLFEPLVHFLGKQCKAREEKDKQNTVSLVSGNSTVHESLHEKSIQVGAIVRVKWTQEEIGDTGWRPGCMVYCPRTRI